MTNGRTIRWLYRGKQGPKSFVETIAMQFNKGANQSAFTTTVRVGGKLAAVMKGTVKRSAKLSMR